MRITNSVLQKDVTRALQKGALGMREAEVRAVSGLRLERPSDDPVAASQVMQADAGLRALEQYRRNLGAGRSRLGAEEGVLDQFGDALSRARELALGQSGSTANAETRSAAKKEIDNLFSMAVQLGNTRFGGAYLFGGNFADQAPLAADGTTSATAPPTGTHAVEIGAGRLAQTSHNAVEIFEDTGAMAALEALSIALGANDPDGIAGAGNLLTDSFSRVQDLLSDVGARVNQLDVAEANVEALDLNLRTFKSDLADVEMEEALSALIDRQVAYQAALMATSKILSTTLMDYL